MARTTQTSKKSYRAACGAKLPFAWVVNCYLWCKATSNMGREMFYAAQNYQALKEKGGYFVCVCVCVERATILLIYLI